MTATATSLPRAERLDRHPLTREHGRLVVGSGLGWALDAMDVGLISFVMAALAVHWELSAGELSLIDSLRFVRVGAVGGAAVMDRLDRFRRDGAGRDARRPARRPARTTPGLRGHPAGLRHRHR